MKRSTKWRWAAGGIAAGFCIGAAVLLIWRFYPQIEGLMQPERMDQFRQWLRSFGIGGVAVLMILQALQVLSGVIPALPIQLAAGLTYGALAGGLFCLLAVGLSSAFVFMLVKRFGKPVADRMFSKSKLDKLAFLHHTEKLEMVVFIIYFIPAMPKDVMTYIAALTPLSMKQFLSITILARAPVIFCDTFASAAVMEGKYGAAIAMFCVIGGLGLLCLFGSKHILSFLKKHG